MNQKAKERSQKRQVILNRHLTTKISILLYSRNYLKHLTQQLHRLLIFKQPTRASKNYNFSWPKNGKQLKNNSNRIENSIHR